MTKQILKNLEILLQIPDLASKKPIYEQYDSQVMNDTIQIAGDAALIRVHGTNKAIATTTKCTPRYVAADAFEGAKQAVAETYRNICAVGARPLAITNCLNFGNPQKPEIMGQIVRAIQGITESCKELNYPVVSGNVSLYNETDGQAIDPTPAIGGVGLLKDLNKRVNSKFKNIGDEIYVIGASKGEISCSLYEREILKVISSSAMPKVDLTAEKNHGELVIKLINEQLVNACHDISDGGLLVALFEMTNYNLGHNLGFEFDISELQNFTQCQNIVTDDNNLVFGEDQGRYIITLNKANIAKFKQISKESKINIFKIGSVIEDKIKFAGSEVELSCLQEINSNFLRQKLFSIA
jgi:phosphoribosylformylglycinamidine (FGAM) synthase-like enzyme